MSKQYTLKDFLPLICISVTVIVSTYLLSAFQGALSSSSHIMTNFMGMFFLIFGGFKVINVQGFATAYAKYDLLAKKIYQYGVIYPFIELALAYTYLTRTELFWTNGITLVLMTFSALGVWNELRKKKEITCACLGALFTVPMTKVTLAEDLLMAIMALSMIVGLV